MKVGPGSGSFDERPSVKVADYDRSIRLLCVAYEELFNLAHCALRARLPADARLLIVGAGTGMEIGELAPRNPGWSFCAVDPSGDMLSVLRGKLSQRPLPNAIEIRKGYVDDLDDEAVFDGATCILVMHFMPDDGSKLALLESVARRLKRGAPMALIDGFGVPGSGGFEALVASWKQYPILRGMPPDEVDEVFSESVLGMIHFVPEARIAELLTLAGFEQVFKFCSTFLCGGWMGFRA